MNSKFKILACLLFISFFSTAQDKFDQSAQFKNLETGNYIAYIAHRASNGKYKGGIDGMEHNLVSVEPEHIFPQDHVIVRFTLGKTEADDYTTFIPEDPAFPITYLSNWYEGTEGMQQGIGWAPQTSRSGMDKRLVVIDDRVYVITDWRDKDNYFLSAVLEKGEMPKGLKAMKLTMKSTKKMNELDPHSILQAYLDEAYAMKDARTEAFLSNGSNRAVFNKIQPTKDAIDKAIRDGKTAYYKSAEFKAAMENNKRAEARDAANNATVINKTGKDIYLYQEGSSNGSRVSTGGSNGTIDCKKSYYYSFSGNSSSSNGTKFYSANSSCGGTITID